MLCTPTLVYLIIAIFGLLIVFKYGKFKPLNLLFVAFWTFIIQLLCSRGSVGLAWLFVFLPMLFAVFAIKK